jgi:FkbM family methyltransferase
VTSPDRLKSLRNRLVAGVAVQRALREHSRAIPISVLRRLPPLGTHTLTAPGGEPVRYVADRDDQFARTVVWRNLRGWESTTVPVFMALARQARAFVDIGAHTGIYTLLAGAANARLQAVAFEPNPPVYERLVRNVAANGLGERVTCRPAALGDAAGSATLFVPADVTAASIVPVGDPAPRGDTVSVTTVVFRADEVLPPELPVDLVKIDVEGAEAAVLRGLSGVLDRWYPIVVAESLRPDELDAVRAELVPHGYRHVWYLGPDGPVEPGTAEPVANFPNYLWATRDLDAGVLAAAWR